MSVLTQPFLGGLFNIAWFGIPTYVFIIILAVFITVAIHFGFWWFYWRPLEYMHGIYRAYWDKINACFIGDLANRYELIPENKAKLIEPHEDYEKLYGNRTLLEVINPDGTHFFDGKPFITRLAVWFGRKFGRNYDMMIAKEIERDIHEAPIINANGIQIDLILDLDNWTIKDSRQRAELNRLADLWNANHPDDEVHTYYKIWNHINQKKLVPAEDTIRHKTIVPWPRILAAFPPEENEASYAGYERQLSEDMSEKEQAEYRKYFWGIILFFLVTNMAMLGGEFMGLL